MKMKVKKKYHLRILDGTSQGYTTSVTSDRMDSWGENYRFYNNIDNEGVNVAFYPSSRTIIESIEDVTE